MAWLPAVKVILPYLTQIIATAIPAFTKKADKAGAEDITRSQIAELQDAATHNAESLRILATQLEQVINDIDSGSSRIEKETRAVRRLASLQLPSRPSQLSWCSFRGYVNPQLRG